MSLLQQIHTTQPMTPADASSTNLIPAVFPARPYVLDRAHLRGRRQERERQGHRQRSGVVALTDIVHQQQSVTGVVR